MAFEGALTLADGVKLDEGRKFVIKQQILAEGEMLLTFLGGAEFVDGAGRLFRRAADGTFLGADLDNLEAWCYSGAALTAAESKRLEGDMQQGASEWKWVVSGHELERGAKITVKQKKEEEEELEPPPKPVTIKGEVKLKDAKGDVFAEVHKDDAAGTVIGAESVIIIKNAKGKEVVRITRGYVTVKNFNVEEIVQIMRGVVSVKTMAGKEMVHVEKGEIYIEDFDGEVIVNNLADVNKLDEEMSLKNL